MDFYSTPEAAKKIGISLITLKRYIAAKKVALPPRRVAGLRVRLWSEEDIEHVRKLLPKIANGRKTRYQKLRAAQKKGAQKHKAQAKKPVPRKRKPKNPKSKT